MRERKKGLKGQEYCTHSVGHVLIFFIVVLFHFRYKKKIFVSSRFRKRLLKMTSTILFSNQNDEPETRRLIFRFEKTK